MKKLILVMALALLSGIVNGQVLSALPKSSVIDTGSYFAGIENVSGVKTTKLFPASKLSAYLAVTPGGVTNSIQTKSSTGTFAGASQFTYSGTAFHLGFPSSTDHLLITVGGQCSIGLTDTVTMSSSTGNVYFFADYANRIYRFGYPSSSRFVIDGTLGNDTLAGNIYLPSLGGSGSGSVGVDNDGKLSWQASTSGPVVLASNDQINQTASLASFATYNPSNSIYSVGGYLTVNSSSGGTVTMQISYKNQQGNAVSKSLFATGQTTAAISSTGSYYFPDIQFRATPGTVITISYTVTGTINYDPGATIMYVRP